MSYNVRDRQGHWVTPPSRINGACPHACCRNRRTHPRSLPVVLDKQYLRSLNETDLEAELHQYVRYTDSHPKAFGQITAELDRRDQREQAAKRSAVRRKERRAQAESEYSDEVYRRYLAAEAATNGYMLNKTGRAAGIDEKSLLTGPESRVLKYGSPELISHLGQHGRPTRESFMGTAKQRRNATARSRLYLH